MIMIDGKTPKDFKLCVFETPIIPTPERDIEKVEIRGRNGALTKKYAYKNIMIPITFNLLEVDGIKPIVRAVKPWLMNGERLSFEDDPSFFYRIVHGHFEDIENQMGIYGLFTVNFECKPFQYAAGQIQSYGTTATIVNNGTVDAEPYIKVYGAGDGSITINEQTIQLKDITDFIELDSEMKLAYKGTTPMGNKMIGDFATLKPGTNTVNLSGGMTKFDILVREAYL